MKNLSLILNIILFVAVGILYYLQLTGIEVKPEETPVTASDSIMPEKVTIAYINEDSLLENYAYFQELASDLEEKRKNMEANYTSRAQGLQSEIENFQRSAGNMTINQARAVEEDLVRKQQNLRQYQETLSQDMMNEESRVNKQLYDRVTAFVEDYANREGITVVLNYRPGSVLLYGHPGMNVTQEVVEGLNREYKGVNQGARETTPALLDTTSNSR